MKASGGDGVILTPERLLRHCLVQLRAYLGVSNPLGGQLVPGANKRKLVPFKTVNTNKHTLSTDEKT